MDKDLITIIVPMHNEAENIEHIYKAVKEAVAGLKYSFEILFVDDGSQDDTVARLQALAEKDPYVVPIELARNFGKEIALTAGLHAAQGQAAIMLDADLQHPPRLIPEFIAKWEQGADLVVGVRSDWKTTLFKRSTSSLFYKLMSLVTETDLVPHATDFRLVDRQVIEAFNKFTERNRITRGLFDWLGFNREVIYFAADERQHGKATYSLRKLFCLARNSFVGHSLFPLKLAGYIGALITIISLPLGIFVFVDHYIFDNTLFGIRFSGNAILAVSNLFLSGVILVCLGFMSLYIANIHQEVINRPLYIARPIEKRWTKKVKP